MVSNTLIRQPALSGTFYPQDPDELHSTIQHFLSAAPQRNHGKTKPQAIIVPHAGYIYSGLTAAFAYKALEPFKDEYHRVVLFGPAHRVYFEGVAVPKSTHFQTPMGKIPLDQSSIDQLRTLPFVQQRDDAHALEHSLEVQLPFLQSLLKNFQLLPIVVGDTPIDNTTKLVSQFLGQPETLVVISSDLSHFHSYEHAQKKDRETCDAILEKDIKKLGPKEACGYKPIQGLLAAMKSTDFHITELDVRNSGDTAGDKQRVVGYGAWLIQ